MSYLGIQAFQICVGLSRPHEHDWLTADVGHGYGRPDLVIDRVKLGQDDPVDGVGIVTGGVVRESSIELDELINGFVTNESLANKENKVGSVDWNESSLCIEFYSIVIFKPEISLERARMSGSLSCILPAVSTSTTSILQSRA